MLCTASVLVVIDKLYLIHIDQLGHDEKDFNSKIIKF